MHTCTCIICGKQFRSRRAAQKLCSPECSKEFKRNLIKHIRQQKRTGICSVCGCEFQYSGTLQKICDSPECKLKSKHLRNAEAWKMQKAEKAKNKTVLMCPICGNEILQFSRMQAGIHASFMGRKAICQES